MAVLKLQVDEFDAIDYDLIAIHAVVEDYRLAFLINQQLPILLHKQRNPIDVKVKEGEVAFNCFEFDDPTNESNWMLIPNKTELVVPKKSSGQNLFVDKPLEIAAAIYLLPEFKKVDYFLKIEQLIPAKPVEAIVAALLKIQQVSTAYVIDTKKIKSKNNLIF